MAILNLFSNDEIESRISESFPGQYYSLFKQRQARRDAWFAQYMQGFEQKPKVRLEQLQAKIQHLTQLLETKPNNQVIIASLNKATEMLNAGDYAVEGTPEWDYSFAWAEHYHARSTAWPDADELAIRQEEEQNLIAKLS